MANRNKEALTPWTRDGQTPVDPDGYAVIRDKRGAPIMFIERSLTETTQDRIAGLVVAAPHLADAIKEIVFAGQDVEEWSAMQWQKWRERHGAALAIALGMNR